MIPADVRPRPAIPLVAADVPPILEAFRLCCEATKDLSTGVVLRVLRATAAAHGIDPRVVP